MKQVFRLVRNQILLAFLLLLTGHSVVNAQIRATLRQSLTPNGLLVQVAFSNTTDQPIQIGDAYLSFNVNAVALNAQNAQQLASQNGRFSGGPYATLQASGSINGSGRFLISLNPDSSLRARTIAPNEENVIVGAVNIPVVRCDLTSGLAWNRDSTGISNNRGQNVLTNPALNLLVEPATQELRPARPTIDPIRIVPATNPGRPQNPFIACNDEQIRIELTPPIATDITAIQFFRQPQGAGAPIPISVESGATNVQVTLNDPNLGFQNLDDVFAVVRTAACTYRSALIRLQIQQKLPPPVIPFALLEPVDSGLCVTPAGQFNIFNVPNLPTNTGFTWSITPASAGTIILNNPPINSNVRINWAGNPGIATVSLRGNNACGPGDEASFNVRFYPTVPNRPTGIRRARVKNCTRPTGALCINDTANAFFELPAGNNNVKAYEWAVFPPEAAEGLVYPNEWIESDTAFLCSQDRVSDSLRIKVLWNRFFQGTEAWVKVRAKNPCGSSVWDSTRFTFNLLPPKPDTLFSVASSDGSIGVDSVCQGTDSTLIRMVYPSGFNSRLAANNRYRWFVIEATDRNTSSGLRGPQDVFVRSQSPLLASAYPELTDPSRPPVRGLVTDSTGVWIKWNPGYYGWVRVAVAAMGNNCAKGGLPNRNSLLPNSPGADTSSMGDTTWMYFFIKPKPLRPAGLATVPVIARAIRKGVDSLVTICVDNTPATRSKYATRYQWVMSPKPDTGNFRVDTVGQFRLPINPTADSLCVTLRVRPDAPSGYYWIYAIGENDCGVSDSSRPTTIHITDGLPQQPNPIFTSALPQPPGGFDLCQNPGSITYSVDSFPSLDATFIRWTISPPEAGAIIGFQGGRPDSNFVTINWNPAYANKNGVFLCATSINGANKDLDSAALAPYRRCQQIKIFPLPTAYAGLGAGSPAAFNMPAYTSARMGGAPLMDRIFNLPGTRFDTTAKGGTRPYRGYQWTTSGLTPPTALEMCVPNLTAAGTTEDFLNPVFTPTEAGNYTFNLQIIDSSGCPSELSAVNFEVRRNLNVRVRALLEGPLNRTNNRMSNLLYTTPAGSRAGLLGSLFEHRRTDALSNDSLKMAPGFVIKGVPAGADSLLPVDVITIQLYSGDTGPLVGEGHAWLMADGSIRDFYNNGVNYCRVGVDEGAPDPPYRAVVRHRGARTGLNGNHLPLYSRGNVTPSTGSNPPAGLQANLEMDREQVVEYVADGSGARALSPPTFPINQRRVAMIAGDVIRDANNQIDSRDYTRVLHRLRTNGGSIPATSPVYQLSDDVNLDGVINQADLDIIKASSLKVEHSLVPRGR